MIGFARKFLLIVPVLLIVGFCLRPTPILGEDGKSLAASVGVPVGETGYEPCKKSEEAWICALPAGSTSEVELQREFLITIDGLGCWEGTVRGSGSDDVAIEGCVTVADHIQAIE
jgi:hypothetical protein